MANTAAKQVATPYRLVYLLTGDGTVQGPTIANATILADMVAGPLLDLWNAAYANQAAMRTAVMYSQPGRLLIALQNAVNDVTAEQNQTAADVDTDAATPTKPEVNIEMSDTTGQIAVLTLEYLHSIIR